ncbi:hypothetical protein pb186bvf_014479 [Paramecium bursaria]
MSDIMELKICDQPKITQNYTLMSNVIRNTMIVQNSMNPYNSRQQKENLLESPVVFFFRQNGYFLQIICKQQLADLQMYFCQNNKLYFSVNQI